MKCYLARPDPVRFCSAQGHQARSSLRAVGIGVQDDALGASAAGVRDAGRRSQGAGIGGRLYAPGGPRGGVVLPALQGGATWGGANIGGNGEAACAPYGYAADCVSGAAMTHLQKRPTYRGSRRCLSVIGRRWRGCCAAVAVAIRGGCALTRPKSGASTHRQASHFPMRVQIRHDICHNLLHQVGEENKSPIPATAQAV